MNTNYLLDEMMAKQQYQEYLASIEHDRLCRQFLANRPQRHDHFLLLLGRLLKTAGRKLKTELRPRSVFAPNLK